MTRVLFFGTHPHCFNGYCIVTYNLAKELSEYDDVDLTVYGFQNFYNHQEHMKCRALPSHVYVYDAFAGENPKQQGFGFDQVKQFVTMNKPDVCVIYNDMVVVSNILNQLKDIKKDMGFKIVVYIDQVYLYQRKEFVDRLNNEADYVLCFTEYWQNILHGCGVTKPMGYLQHGFDPKVHYPVPKSLARKYYGLKDNDFIVLNLNRNQPRKRWDVCLQAFAEVVSRHEGEPIKMLIATSTMGAWNLMELYERELKKRGISLEEGKKHIILVDNPQQLSDEDVNILYNVADVGINTCDGEGFGLCNFQQAAIGIPQIVPFIGGFRDFFDDSRAITIAPKYTMYIEATRDGVGGEAEICDWLDVANAIDELYCDDSRRQQIGANARQYILSNYKWKDITKKFHGIVHEVVHGVTPSDGSTSAQLNEDDISSNVSPDVTLDDIRELNKEFDESIVCKDYVEEKTNDDPQSPTSPAPSVQPHDAPKIEHHQSNDQSETAKLRKELTDIKAKLEALLSAVSQ